MVKLTPTLLENGTYTPQENEHRNRMHSKNKLHRAHERNQRAFRTLGAVAVAAGVIEVVTHLPSFAPPEQTKIQLIQEHGLNGPDDIGYRQIELKSPK